MFCEVSGIAEPFLYHSARAPLGLYAVALKFTTNMREEVLRNFSSAHLVNVHR